GLFTGAVIEELDLYDFQLPLYRADDEAAHGIPEPVYRFLMRMKAADLIVLSLAEHNGTFTAAFKNVLDWASRADRNVFQEKPMLLLATSEGRQGATSVLQDGQRIFPFLGGNIVATFSLPAFSQHFDYDCMTMRDATFREQLSAIVANVQRQYQPRPVYAAPAASR
ncbi:MAG: NAD(P)H-dependent oxidoreductase, partial [Lewinella sp.]|nr:NAD(P)H-dependent oxidoreductase [Lewinella sp.]